MKNNSEFASFEKRIGYVFKDKQLVFQAFLHRSYLNEHAEIKIDHNERLEFLGDAVLELIVTDALFLAYPHKTEGDLTAYRAALVNANIISEVARDLGMNEYLLLSKGEAKDTGKARSYIMANAYEALIGAIYLDSGYASAEKFVKGTILLHAKRIVEEGLFRDSKSLIQEKAQQYFSVTPQYKVMAEHGPDHDKQFMVAIYFGQEKIATGEGKSKQEAEQKAAQVALLKKKWLD